MYTSDNNNMQIYYASAIDGCFIYIFLWLL